MIVAETVQKLVSGKYAPNWLLTENSTGHKNIYKVCSVPINQNFERVTEIHCLFKKYQRSSSNLRQNYKLQNWHIHLGK